MPLVSLLAAAALTGGVLALICAALAGYLNLAPPSDAPRTLHLVGNWPSDTGYAWHFIEELWIALARAHPGRTILTFPKLNGLSPALRAAGIEVIEFAFDLKKPEELARFAKHHNVGHLYLSDQAYASPVYRRLRRAGVETITMHDHTPGTMTVPTGMKALAKALKVRLQGCDAYLATTPHVVRRHIEVVRAPRSRCYLAPNGVDANPYTRAQSTIRQELGIGRPETVLVVSCSRAAPIKRIEVIIEAAERLKHRDVLFIHLGKGSDIPHWETLQRLIRDKGLTNFRLLGDRDDVPRVLPGCDIAVHAAQGEVGYSLATLEAMAAGLPCIVRDDPSVSGCIVPGETGLVFRSLDDLVTALAELMELPARRVRLGAQAREAVLTRYRRADTIAKTVSAVMGLKGPREVLQRQS
jgi:glycosyltransferase involved in cell wall biosynthesis